MEAASQSLGLKTGEVAIVDKSDERRARRITCQQQDHPAPQPASVFICQGRRRDCKSRINWPLQQHKTMFPNKPARRYSIVEFDWRVPTTAWLNLLLNLCKSLKKASASHIICDPQRLDQNDFFFITVDGQLHPGSEHLNIKASGKKMNDIQSFFNRGNLFCYFFYSKYIGKEQGSVPRAGPFYGGGRYVIFMIKSWSIQKG